MKQFRATWDYLAYHGLKNGADCIRKLIQERGGVIYDPEPVIIEDLYPRKETEMITKKRETVFEVYVQGEDASENIDTTYLWHIKGVRSTSGEACKLAYKLSDESNQSVNIAVIKRTTLTKPVYMSFRKETDVAKESNTTSTESTPAA